VSLLSCINCQTDLKWKTEVCGLFLPNCFVAFCRRTSFPVCFVWIILICPYNYFNIVSASESSLTCQNKMKRHEFWLIRYGTSLCIRTARDQGPRSSSSISPSPETSTHISFPFVNPVCGNQYRLCGNS
jgi:hypothetical protein